MAIQYILSVCIFVLFVIIVLIRAEMLRKRGVHVIVFGQTDKSDFFLVPVVLVIAYTVIAKTFGLPIWGFLIYPFWISIEPGWLGLLLCLVSIVGFTCSLLSFGSSFRVGIDENKPDKLITNGMFAFSRNPVYVCFLLFFIGLFLIHRNITITVGLILFALVIHRQILREEKFLVNYYGTEYNDYCKKVRRYL